VVEAWAVAIEKSAQDPGRRPKDGVRVLAATMAGLWTVYALFAACAVPLLDDWYQIDWLAQHALTPATLVDYVHYNYFHHNPRLGETFLLLGNASRAFHVVVTATVELVLLAAAFALVHGRWPGTRAEERRADAVRLLILQAFVWAIAPRAGMLYFYRPFTTNYLFGLCFQLLLFVPYRFALVRAPRWPVLTTAAVVVLGWAAGMSNEHTGPAAIVALALLVVVLARRGGGVRAWMLAGLAALVVGYVMLFFAPGQSERYAGVATRTGPLTNVIDRGVEGTLDVLLEQVRQAFPVVLALAIATLAAVARARRTGAPSPVLARPQIGRIAAFVLAAATIVATLTASPLVGERLYFAPSFLVAMAALVVFEALAESAPARRLLVAAAGVFLVVYAGLAARVHAATYVDGTARVRALADTPPGEVATIPPFRFPGKSVFALGDDLRAEYLRTYVARQIYGLGGITFDAPRRDVQVDIPWRVELDVTVDPPLTRAELDRRVPPPLRYVPAGVDRLTWMLRRYARDLAALPGHRLVGIVAHVVGLDVPERGTRPLLAATWKDGRLHASVAFALDHATAPYFQLDPTGLSEDADEMYLVACGQRTRVTARPAGRGRRVDFTPTCRGWYALVACTKAECWLAGSTIY
jgi:hypothetical protein